jgi:hypothetical protein
MQRRQHVNIAFSAESETPALIIAQAVGGEHTYASPGLVCQHTKSVAPVTAVANRLIFAGPCPVR